MGIHDGHRQRLKERYVNEGLENFSDHEILELLLFYSIPQRDTNQIAHELINHFGSLGGVFTASVSDLTKIKDITQNTAVLITMIPKIIGKAKAEKISDLVLDNVDDLCKYCKSLFFFDRVEKLKIVCLDNKLRVIGVQTLSDGTAGRIKFDARQVVEVALKYKSDIIVLTHNHPRGDSMPSNSDVAATNSISTTLSAIGIKLLDHIIVSGDNARSMKNEGELFQI